MATRTQCPNCNTRNKNRSLYRCKNCRFIGCYKSGFLNDEGCWKKKECPRCGYEEKPEHFGYVADYDSN